jgi:hypothetical protein
MSSKHSVASSASTLIFSADDLKLIDGIGPAIERHLHSAGILTFAQIADLSPEELAALLHGYAGLSAQQIAKRDWIGQARRLASTATLDEPQAEASKRVSAAGQVTFKVQLRVDGNNNVRSTHVTYVQDGSEEKWAGWDEAKLVDFFARSAALQLAIVEPAEPDTAAAEPLALATPTAEIGGLPRLDELAAISGDSGDRSRLLHHGQPLEMRLALDLGNVSTPGDTALGYTATFYAKRLGTGERELIGQVRGAAIPGGEVILNAKGADLPEGVYRLEAAVSLVSPTAAAESCPDISAFLEGSLLYVY